MSDILDKLKDYEGVDLTPPVVWTSAEMTSVLSWTIYDKYSNVVKAGKDWPVKLDGEGQTLTCDIFIKYIDA